MIKVSIIIPCFDISSTIDGCLDSINQQKYNLPIHVEVICIVDGNYEDLKYIKSWEKKNSENIKFELKSYLLSNNKGAGYARNFGYSKSSGDFIAFLDDDDIWKEDKLNTQLKWHLNNPEKIMSGHFYSKGKDRINLRIKGKREITFRNLLIGGFRVSTPTIMIRRELWPFRPEKLRYCEDWLMVSMISSIENIYIIPELLAYRSLKAKPIHKDPFSLSSHKIRLRLGKIKAILILYKRGKIENFTLLFCMILQFILFFKSIFNRIKK